ncbi:hypothetical protein Sjap_000565 [Stephania japonica]|uniref:Uncharacterized protein n=1 Tax=Stephania japonica TaxID=461633 RepID=A0AAP0PSK1_9MAGN
MIIIDTSGFALSEVSKTHDALVCVLSTILPNIFFLKTPNINYIKYCRNHTLLCL